MTDVSAFLIATAAVLAALTGIAVFIRKLLIEMRKSVTALNDINGIPARPGFDAQPGVLERLKTIDEKLSDQASLLENQGKQLAEHGKQIADIHHELHPNSGKSSRDILDRLDRANTMEHGAPTADAA